MQNSQNNTHNSQQQPASAGFNLASFAEHAQRRTDRLVRAAYGVGGTHAWFRALPRAAQVAKVSEWVEEALMAAAARRAGLAAEWADEEFEVSTAEYLANPAGRCN